MMVQFGRLRLLVFVICCFTFSSALGQVMEDEIVAYEEPEPSSVYRASETRYFDLIHTKLEVSFDLKKRYLLGNANLTLTPLFFDQDELVLDAKGMDLKQVALLKEGGLSDLKYDYDQKEISIQFDQVIDSKDTIEVFIEYVAKPMELESNGSAAIEDNRGLYFINPTGEDSNVPTQIWTQGETEASSAWFPTIDAPNERCTQEISITVENRFNTLSNGAKTNFVNNPDGTRTDTWKMTQPHAPYLFMMAIGEYAIVEDEWNGIPVRYHVEKEYKDHAQAIFGNTPEMMTLFSELLDYPYPWPSYDQVVVRDFVSGAMENTTSSTFMESLHMTKREMVDFNWDDIIAHELFHQWFGDLVTCESWSNLALNEGFASYSEYLWNEYKYGTDEADYRLLSDYEQYFDEAENEAKHLIRYYYDDKEDMFDRHSYNKGGAVLHMLRNYLGDKAFFAGLNKYLKDNAFQSVELANLRLAFEAVCGEDLNWFFDQWYFVPGHPHISVNHQWKNDTVKVEVRQNQSTAIYKLPVFIDIWSGGKKKTSPVILKEAIEIYEYPMKQAPDLVVFDSERNLLAQISHELTDEELVFQLQNDPTLYGRLQAMDSLYAFKNKKLSQVALETAFKDSYYLVRQYALEHLIDNEVKLKKYEAQVAGLLKDESPHVRAMSITYVGRENFDGYQNQIETALNDSSYRVVGAALNQYVENKKTLSPEILKLMSAETNLNVVIPLGMHYVGDESLASYQWFEEKLQKIKTRDLFYFIQIYAEKLLEAPKPQKEQAAKSLQEIARNGSHYTARLAAYQALHLLVDVEGITDSIEDIRENETDERLLEWYQQF